MECKSAILLLSLLSLTACDSDNDNNNRSVSSPNPKVEIDKPDTTKPDTTKPDTTKPGKNLLINGGFETWVDGKLTGWPIIDSGITVAKNSATVKTDLSSAAITMTKSGADFRQSVDVEAGKTYTLSMSINHTEGGVRVRAYLGGNYANDYSDPTLTSNQWQDYSFEYKATESKVIEIGMRFYTVKDGVFDGSEVVYIDNVTLVASGEAKGPDPLLPPPVIKTDSEAVAAYYASAEGKTGSELKTALYNIIKDHTTKSYGDLWTFMSTYSLDTYYENDNSILDMYTENPSASDSYNFRPGPAADGGKQCGNYKVEGDCYNREHSMPQSWFKEASPMVSDVHHIFATDGKVNSNRSNYPYGDVESATYTSSNGSVLGSPTAALTAQGFKGDTVFEPIDEFKGDFARAYFYMATRYENIVGTWATNSDNAGAVLDGSSDKVFKPWVITMLRNWHENDPVSPKEQYRNEAALMYQGNRNPFVDHPEFVDQIWAD